MIEAREKLEIVKADLEDTKAELAEAKRQLAMVHMGPGDVWRWQGGGDDLGGLSCPVVMEAATLKALIAKTRAAPATRRPTLAECIGVPERWQALACLYAMLELQPLPWAWRWAEMASRAIRNRRSRYVLSGLARGAIDEGERAGGADRAICRLIAWELACELVERRKREREQEA